MDSVLFRKQLEGAVFLIAAAVVFYVGASLAATYKSGIEKIPYGDVSSGSVIVEIAGSTGHDGIYYVPQNTTVMTLLGYAGIVEKVRYGIETGEALLMSGQKVILTADGSVRIGEMGNARKLACNLPIDINRAVFHDFLMLPGVGEKTAWKIIIQRNRMGGFQKIEDLMTVRGIKEGKFKKLKKYVTVNKRTRKI